MTPAVSMPEPVLAPEEERVRIKQIEEVYRQEPTGQIKLLGPHGEETVLPESVQLLLQRIIALLAQGEAVAIVPIRKEFTTQEAADLLSVSRQYLVRLLEHGEIPFHKTGTHRRIRFGDLMEYKRRRDQQRRQDLDRLTELSQEMGLYQ